MTTTPAAHPACDKLIAIAQKMRNDALEVFKGSCNHTIDAIHFCHSLLSVELERIASGQPGYVTRPPYPQGLKVMPEIGEEYWVVDVDEPMKAVWDGHPDEGCFFNAGLLYPATPEGEAHAKLAWQARFGGERG